MSWSLLEPEVLTQQCVDRECSSELKVGNISTLLWNKTEIKFLGFLDHLHGSLFEITFFSVIEVEFSYRSPVILLSSITTNVCDIETRNWTCLSLRNAVFPEPCQSQNSMLTIWKDLGVFLLRPEISNNRITLEAAQACKMISAIRQYWW